MVRLIYEPKEDSFLLQKFVKKYARNRNVLDMGSGGGIQAETAIKEKAVSVEAADINKKAVKILKEKGIKSYHSNLFSKVKGKFDMIVFNPPYLPEDKREDKESALATTGGKKGDEIILRFLEQSPKHLNKEGIILIVISSLTPKNRINNLIKKLNFSKRILSKKRFFMEILEIWIIKNNKRNQD